MGSILIPPDIETIFDKPGRCWTDQERHRVKVWLYEARQLRYLLYFAVRHLGRRATADNAEDTWGEFTVQGLDGVIRNYDPGKGRRFWTFLLFCFERFCHHESQKRLPVEGEPLPQVESPDPAPTPGEVLERAERQRIVRQAVESLKPKYREVIVMHYFEEKSVAQIAKELGISVGCVKVRLFRARQRLAQCPRLKEV